MRTVLLRPRCTSTPDSRSSEQDGAAYSEEEVNTDVGESVFLAVSVAGETADELGVVATKPAFAVFLDESEESSELATESCCSR